MLSNVKTFEEYQDYLMGLRPQIPVELIDLISKRIPWSLPYLIELASRGELPAEVSRTISWQDLSQKYFQDMVPSENSVEGYRNFFVSHYQQALQRIRADGSNLTSYSREFQDDWGFVRLAVSTSKLAFFYASARLKNDPHIVLSAIVNDPTALCFASVAYRMSSGINEIAAISDKKKRGQHAREWLKKNVPIKKESPLYSLVDVCRQHGMFGDSKTQKRFQQYCAHADSICTIL